MRHFDRSSRALAFGAVVLTATACVDQATPTSALFEQAVFAALGGLQPGESLTLTGSAAAEAITGGSTVPGDFVYIPFHASRVRGSNLLLSVEGENVSSQVVASLAPVSTALPLLGEGFPDSGMHEAMHARMQAAVAPYLRSAGQAGLRRSLTPPAVRRDLSGSNAFEGQLVQINANASGSGAAFCTRTDFRTGRVEAIGQRAIVVGDIGNPAGGFTNADYRRFADEIDDLVYPTVTSNFSEPTDIDQNSRVIVFFTRAVNEITRPEDQGYVGGFFASRDLFPRELCPASNEAEIFFNLVPDPEGIASHIRHSRDNVFRGALNTVGHEMQHLINAGRRIYINDAETFEEVWLDEGLSHMAEELLFYEDSGLQPRSNIGDSVLASQAIINSLLRFMVQNLGRYDYYIENVTTNSPTNSEDLLETRGAAWAFLRYLADHTERGDAELLRALVNSRIAGFENLEAVLDEDPIDWLQRWGISVYTDDIVAGDAPLLQQPSWDFRSMLPAAYGAFRLDVQSIGSGETLELDLMSGTSGYIRFRGIAGMPARLRTTSAGAPPPSELRVTIVRVR